MTRFDDKDTSNSATPLYSSETLYPSEMLLPIDSQLIETIQNFWYDYTKRAEARKVQPTQSDFYRWLQIISQECLTLELAEELSHDLGYINYGSIKLTIVEHTVTNVEATKSTRMGAKTKRTK